MKKINLMIAAGLLCAASVQAQTTIASVGFEPGDTKYTTKYAYTPGGTYGNWVNQQGGDVWTEPNDGDAHSGDYSFLMNNTDQVVGNTWDRGFVIGNLQLKENTSYRVSFRVKANETYINPETGNEAETHVKSSMAIGREYCDMPISTASGLQYYYNFAGFNSEWKHISYMTFFTNKADQDKYSINYTGKADPEGNIVWPQDTPFPDDYFMIINMYNPGEYVLDDIKIEEGVTFNEALFNSGNTIRLDFGYPTNIADLAKVGENDVVTLPTSCVSVSVNGNAVVPEYVEGKKDGYLYIFLPEEVVLQASDAVSVSFTPADDCPIIYNNDRRPSADVTTELKVFGFANETAYFDESIDAVPAVWGAPKMVSSNPENESFDLDAASFNNIAVTYDKELSLKTASAILTWDDNFGSHELPVTDKMSLSADKKTINIAVSGLQEVEYTLTISDVENSFGIPTADKQVIIFALGKSDDTATSEVIYASDFDNDMTDGIPPGWNTYNEAGYHLYGFNDEERTSQYNYGWGGNPGGGGTRLYAGFNGDFNKAMYWGSRGTNEGDAEYGSLVKDYLNEDGTLSDDAPEGIALKLEPRKYNISFLMAAWKGEPTFTFTLEDLEGNVYARFDNYLASPNMNGNTGKVTGSVKCEADFTVDKEGYYVLRFTAAEAQWQEYLLANVKLITMPSKSAYWKGELAKVVEKVQPTLEEASAAVYDGATKSALAAAIEKANAGGFTSGTQIQALINELEELSAALTTRRENIDNYDQALLEAQVAVETLEGKYVDAPLVVEAKAIIDKYNAISASTLSDEELAAAAPALAQAVNKVKNAKNAIDYLTYGVYKAAQTAEKFGVDPTEGYNATSDDRALAAEYNVQATLALYKKIAAKESLDDLMSKLYDGTVIDSNFEEGDPNFDEQGHPLVGQGIDFTGLIWNPNFYTMGTDASKVDFPGWTFEPLQTVDPETGEVTSTGSAKMNAAATSENPVIATMLNGYGASSEYKIYQVIENLPAGVYTVAVGSRTAQKNQPDAEGNYGVFNAQSDETGLWDKYVFVQVEDGTPLTTPFAIGTIGNVYPSLVKDVVVKEGQKITIGAIEHYASGKASGHNWDAELGAYEPKDFWDTNSYVGDTKIYFSAPLEGFDYAAAANTLETAIETVEAPAAAQATSIYNLAGQKVDANYKGIVIKNGKKVLVK